MIDACCTHANVVNSGVTAPNLTKFPHGVEQVFLINLLKSELRFAVHFTMPACQCIGKMWPSLDKNRTLYPHNLQSYCTEVYQIFT